jgi:hypothetical protein
MNALAKRSSKTSAKVVRKVADSNYEESDDHHEEEQERLDGRKMSRRSLVEGNHLSMVRPAMKQSIEVPDRRSDRAVRLTSQMLTVRTVGVSISLLPSLSKKQTSGSVPRDLYPR